MDNLHQGSKPPKPARVGGPHSGRRKPDFDDTGEQLHEHRRSQSPSLSEAAQHVERHFGAVPRIDRDARPPRLEMRSGNTRVILERERLAKHDSGERVRWQVRSEDTLLIEYEADFEKAIKVFLEVVDA